MNKYNFLKLNFILHKYIRYSKYNTTIIDSSTLNLIKEIDKKKSIFNNNRIVIIKRVRYPIYKNINLKFTIITFKLWLFVNILINTTNLKNIINNLFGKDIKL